MTVSTQNLAFLPAAAAAKPAGGAAARVEGGTPFLDLMAAVDAQRGLAPEVGATDGGVCEEQAMAAIELPTSAGAESVRPATQAELLDLPQDLRPIELHLIARALTSAQAVESQFGQQTRVPADALAGLRLPVRDEPAATPMPENRSESLQELPQGSGDDGAANIVDTMAATGSELIQVALEHSGERAAAQQIAVAPELLRSMPVAAMPEAGGRARGRDPIDLRAHPQQAARAPVSDVRADGDAIALRPEVEVGSGALQARRSARAQDASDTFSEAILRAAGQGSEEGVTAAPTMAKDARPQAPAQLQVEQPFGDQRWSAAMNARVLTMMRDGVAQARVEINPANLGPVGIDLSMRNGVVNVAFDSPHVEVREALKDGAKGLERSLVEGGVQLGRVEVRDTLDFMGQGRGQRDPNSQQDAQGGHRQQQEGRQPQRGQSDFSAHLRSSEDGGES